MTNEEMLELVNMHHRAMSKVRDITNEPKDVNVAEVQPLGCPGDPQKPRGTGGWEQHRCDLVG